MDALSESVGSGNAGAVKPVENRFGALVGSDTDDSDDEKTEKSSSQDMASALDSISLGSSGSDKRPASVFSASSTKSNRHQDVDTGFKLAAPSFATQSTQFPRLDSKSGKPEVLASAFGDLSEMIGAIDQAKKRGFDVTEERRQLLSKAHWDLDQLRNATIETVPVKERFNPLLQMTIKQHEREASALEDAIYRKSRRKDKKRGNANSRKARARKAKARQRGADATARREVQIGRAKRKRRGRKLRTSMFG